MKKRILILCGILVLMAALSLLPAGATEPTATQDIDFSAGGTVNGYCQHCKTNVDWLPLTQEQMDTWGKNYSTANGTHYYVCYTAEDQTKVTLPTNTGLEIGSGEELCVHLNGKQLYRGGARAFAVTGTLNIMDHAAEEGTVVAFANTTSTGMVVRLMTSGAKCNLYGGTLQMKTGSSAYAKSGGCVYCVNGSSFTMYGGTLTGGIAGLGGNLYVEGGATASLLGGTITGGLASGGSNYGGNVYCNGAMTLGNCNITGGTAALGSDLYFPADGTMIVKNDFAGETYVSLNAAHLPDPLVNGCLTDTTMTCEGTFAGKLYLVKSSEQYELYGKENDTKLYVKEMERADVDFSAGGTVNGYCQSCKTNVDWKPLTEDVCSGWGTNYSESNGTHYYVAADKVKLAGGILTVAAGEELCLHLNGNTLYRGNIRAFNVSGTLSIMDHAANEGVLYAYAESTSTGGVIRLAAATGELNLYGGTVQMKTGNSHQCVSGGTVYMVEKSKFYMYGGTLKDGVAENGGNVYVNGGCTFEMHGGSLVNGTAVRSGTETTKGMGGNLYMNYTSESGGSAVTISNANISGGTAGYRGGNLYNSATPNTLTVSNTVITGGVSASGGSLYLNNGYITITNSTITGGKSTTYSGGNIYANAGNSSAENYLKLIDTTVSGGSAITYGGNIYCNGKVTFDGNTRVYGGTAGTMGDNMYVSSSGKLTVTAGYAGEASTAIYASRLSTPIRGGTVDSTAATCEGVFTGKLMIENDPQHPTTYAKSGDATLYVNAAAVVKNDGTKVWYDSNVSAVAAYDSNTKYLVAMEGDLALNGNYTVDLCGAEVNITGTGNVTLIDTANKDYKTYGTATVSGVTVANDTKTAVDGTDYIMIEEEGVYSFHCLGTKLVGVSIRPSSSGMYYTGQWDCDEKLAARIEKFGVAVSLRAMPTESFATTSHCLYTEFAAGEMTSGTQKTGVIIEGILKEERTAALNNRYGRMPIYAQAYAKLTDGTVIINTTGAGESLYTAMTRTDDLIRDNVQFSKENLGNVREFYNKWKESGMGSWDLHSIPVPEKVNDGKLNLLMVGNSFCYYYVEELYALLMENLPEGITEVNIYNVYHSGCTVTTHYNKWLADEAYYTLFKTSAEGRVALTGEYTATLEEALRLEEDWDYISLQGTVASGSNYPKAEEIGMQYAVAEVAEPLLDRFHDLFPNAQLLWHRTWPLEEGRRTSTTSASIWTEEYARNYNIGMQFVCDYMCNEFDQNKPYDLVQVNSGAAWPTVRAQNAALEESLLPFGGLCARLGLSTYGENLEGYDGVTTHSGDGQHEGDIGGGQLLNAYAWYETLTGNDCRETVYRPVYTYGGTEYTLSEELVTILQNAVHAVVPEMPETVQPAA